MFRISVFEVEFPFSDWSRDTLNFDVLKKGLGIVSLPHFEYGFLTNNVSHVLLTDQIPLSDYLYFLRYWVICVLHLFGSQVVTS